MSLTLGIPYHFNFFKGCLPQILRGPFLNTLIQIFVLFIFACQTKMITDYRFIYLIHFSRSIVRYQKISGVFRTLSNTKDRTFCETT